MDLETFTRKDVILPYSGAEHRLVYPYSSGVPPDAALSRVKKDGLIFKSGSSMIRYRRRTVPVGVSTEQHENVRGQMNSPCSTALSSPVAIGIVYVTETGDLVNMSGM